MRKFLSIFLFTSATCFAGYIGGSGDQVLRVPHAGGRPRAGSIDLSKSAAVGSSVLGITNGGTGQATANAALNALLPSQGSFSGDFLKTDGTNASWVPKGAPTSTLLTSSSSGSYYAFIFNSANVFAGDTYTNNGATFTVVNSCTACTVLYATGTGAPTTTGGTLTKSTGSGPASYTFFGSGAKADIYTTPANAASLTVFITAAGGGGASSANTTAGTNASAGGGGGSGATCVINIANPAATYYFLVGTGGTAGAINASGATGAAGYSSTFNTGGAFGGSGGSTSGVQAAAPIFLNNGGGGGTYFTNCDYGFNGETGTGGFVLGFSNTGSAVAGDSGGSFWAHPQHGFANASGISQASSWGIGGSGGSSGNGNTSHAGGAGVGGAILVQVYY